MVDILGIAAHPDDIEMTCGGVLLVAKRQGKRTGILDLTNAELSTRGTVETRKVESDTASKALELDWRGNISLPDGNIELSQDNLYSLIKILREQRPTILLTPHHTERHPDHEAASELAKRAVFYSGLQKIKVASEDGTELAPHRPLLVLHYMQTYTFDPTVIIDVSSVWTKRMEAVRAYISQFNVNQDVLQARSKEPETFLTQAGFHEWMEARARHYGMIIGAEFGEPFWSYQPVGTKDPFALVTKKIS